MKTFLLGTLAAVGLSLGAAAPQASAHWETRTTWRWDPAYGRSVAVAERYWVPDVAVYVPGVTVYQPYQPAYAVEFYGHPRRHRYEHHRGVYVHPR